jgi:hypothetical protein
VIDRHGRLDTVECLGCGARLARADVQTLLRRWNPGLAGPGARVAPDGDAHLERARLEGFRVPDCPECGAYRFCLAARSRGKPVAALAFRGLRRESRAPYSG